ncbi:MAG TPA: hypothetical protein DCZ75_04610 [Geobacter sp.]|nr:hypothetical protein [Geobacter sp.]
MAEKHRYDEKQELPSPWEWVILVAFSAAIMGFGWLVYLVVQDGPRRWDFGQLPDAPAESVYSTEVPRAEQKPRRQIPALPEALPQPPARGKEK